MRIPFLYGITSVFLLAVAAAQAQPLTLNSGSVVEPLISGPLISTKGWSAHVLEYRSQLSAKDLVNLRLEADEVWNRFINDTMRAGRDQAILMVRTPESGTTPSPAGTTNFSYKKYGDMWRTSEWPESTPAKLDETFVRRFVARFDNAYRYRNANTFLLYLAEEWFIESTSKDKKDVGTLSDMVSFWRNTLPTATEVQVHRDITNITIAFDGQTATVESQGREIHVFKPRRIETRSKAVNYIAVRDNFAVVTKTIVPEFETIITTE